MNEAADRLAEFEKPALIAWSREDRFFKPAHAERLVNDLPNARLAWIENARSLSPEDEPGRLAELIADFVHEPTPAHNDGDSSYPSVRPPSNESTTPSQAAHPSGSMVSTSTVHFRVKTSPYLASRLCRRSSAR
jgi:hypothetical protein